MIDIIPDLTITTPSSYFAVFSTELFNLNMSAVRQKRVMRELQSLMTSPPDGLKVCDSVTASGEAKLDKIHIELEGPGIYDGEKFKLQFRFNQQYPFKPPIVTFVPPACPLHPHVYSNGHICLSILYDGWTPAMSTESVCLSIISMLNSCTKKVAPMGNQEYVQRAPSNPQNTHWVFEDDTV